MVTRRPKTKSKTRGRARPSARPHRTRGTSRTHAPVMPISNAKTAYGLLGDIAKIIVAEPKRYDQTNWIARKGTQRGDNSYAEFPACGTVGCVAGWVVALAGPRNTSPDRVEKVAEKILGLDGWDSMELFDANAAGSWMVTSPQTLEHAEAGAKHIQKFRKQYRAKLMAKRIEVSR